ncbi:phage tail tube protein [Christensenellaceae bacterium OttesenSCG-928-M15]|nr:phage tail tube protein [Christensenellaceae bacterium OttesenSCG-928-M15]
MLIFESRNAISSKEATAFIQIDGRNEELFYAKSIEATATKNKEEVRALGRRGVGHKAVSWQGEGTLTIYRVTSLFKRIMLRYINEGVDTYFSLVCTNDDPTTQWGAETTLLTDCNFDEVDFASFDTEDGLLEQELPFTFEGGDLMQEFKEIDA